MSRPSTIMMTVGVFAGHVVMAVCFMADIMERREFRLHCQAMRLLGKDQQPGEHKAQRQDLSQI